MCHPSLFTAKLMLKFICLEEQQLTKNQTVRDHRIPWSEKPIEREQEVRQAEYHDRFVQPTEIHLGSILTEDDADHLHGSVHYPEHCCSL
jgi:hypothetical protein